MYKGAILALAAILPAFVGSARAAPDFQGKTVTIMIGAEAGSGFDTYGRLFARFFGAHLPGRPTVVVENMPGAGGLLAANYLYNVAPRDGTVVGVIGQVAAINQVLGRPGVHYDVRKLLWVGRLVSNSQILLAWAASGIRTIGDAMTHEVVVAGTSADSSSVVFPRLMNDLVGTKFKDVPGYNGSASATLAMERGEVEAVVRPWNDIKAQEADWLREKKINLLVQLARTRNPELPNVPAVVDLARNEEQRQLLGLFASGSDVGYPVAAPPGLAPAVAATLRNAFDAEIRDPQFIAAARRENLTLDPLSGPKLQALNDEALAVSARVVELAKKYSPGD